MNENIRAAGYNAAELALEDALRAAVQKAAAECGKELPSGMSFELERPKREGQGDRAGNAAMQLAKPFGMSPRDVAARIVGPLQEEASGLIDRVEVAGPGFINLFLSPRWFALASADVLRQGPAYGGVNLGRGRRVQVEFVSANPTGPLHIGHGRGAAVGDSVARILTFTGWEVEREYYINDAGLQMEMLGQSIRARYFEVCGHGDQAPLPEDGYHGAYLVDMARKIQAEEGDRLLSMPVEESLIWFRKRASEELLANIRDVLKCFGIEFDVWFSEKSLYTDGLVPVAMERLKERDCAFEKDGALWFKATEFEDEKDRVLIRANGVPTYFASDIAYHQNKFITRGFDRVIDVWGADHHGYIPRMKAGIEAFGGDPDAFDVLLIQMVSLLDDGNPVRMSKRTGEIVTLKEVLDDVGVDATRFFFLMRRSDSQMDFDLAVAKKQSSDNPVYYVQYAHARICSILREWEKRGGDVAALRAEAELPEAIFENRDARALADTLSLFPLQTAEASRDLAPQMLTSYAHTLAGAFHSFYNTNRILGESAETERGRLKLAEATRAVLASCLNLLGVSAPEQM